MMITKENHVAMILKENKIISETWEGKQMNIYLEPPTCHTRHTRYYLIPEMIISILEVRKFRKVNF